MTRHKELRFSSQNSSLVKDWSGAGHLTVWTQDRLELRLSWYSTLTKRPFFQKCYAMSNDPRNYCQFFWLASFRGQPLKTVNMSEKCRSVTETSDFLRNRGFFFKSPETFRAFFRCFNSFYTFVTQRVYVIKLCNHLCLSYVHSMLKDQLLNKKGLQFDNWIFVSETFPGLLRKRSKAWVAFSWLALIRVCYHIHINL